RLTKEDPDHWGWKSALALIHQHVAVIYYQRGQLDAADQCLTAAREITAELVERDPLHPTWKAELADVSISFATLRMMQDQPAESVDEHLEGQRLLGELLAADPDRTRWKYSLAIAQLGFGGVVQGLVDATDDEVTVNNLLVLMLAKVTAARQALAALVEQDG